MRKLYVIVALFMAMSCGTTNSSTDTSEARESGTPTISFEQASMALTVLKQGEESWPNESYTITLNINLAEGSYNGKSGCNNYFGTVERLDDGHLKFGMAGVTEMMCEEDIMHWEARYLNALTDHVFSVYDIKNGVILKDDQNGTALTFSNAQP